MHFHNVHDGWIMSDLLLDLEKVRFRARLSQEQIARALGVTQGHYSKLITGKVPLRAHLQGRIEAWLERQGSARGASEPVDRINELASSIRRQCIELMHLVQGAEPEKRG